MALVLAFAAIACSRSETWPESELASHLPKPDKGKIDTVHEFSDSLSVTVKGIDSSDYELYVRKCIEAGYTEEASKSSTSYEAFNADGYSLDLDLYSSSKELHILLEGMEPDASLRSILSRMTKLVIIESTEQETIVRPTTFGNILYLMDEIVDRKAELEKIDKELERLEKEIARSEGMLKNERFLAKAPAEKIEEERNKLMNYQSSYDTLKEKKKELDQ